MEGQEQQSAIRDILDSTTDKIQLNPNYIAYEIMVNDPYNKQSVEYLSTKQQVWQHNCKNKQDQQDQ